MDKSTLIAVVALIFALVVGVAVYSYQPESSEPVSNFEDSSVRTFVTEFGSKFKNVSLLADNRGEQVEKEYAAYVAPELLAKWKDQTESAPGRYSSSPWPDRIEIVSVTPSPRGINIYAVEGNVIEITSADGQNPPAAVYPISMLVEKRDGAFVVTSLSKGAYSQLPQRMTIVGYWECLPHKDRTGPQTMECAFGIAVDQSDGHYAVDTSLMSQYPVDYPTGTKVRVTGVVTPANQLSSIQKYDIDGIIRATVIEKL